MKLNEIFINEGAALQLEKGIVNAFTGSIKKPKDPVESASINIVTKLKKVPKAPKGNKGEHFGSGSASITSTWSKWGGTDNTPKTDIILGKHHVSLKIGKSSQLVSAQKGDASALVMSVLETESETKAVINKMAKMFEQFVTREFTKKGSISDALEAEEAAVVLTDKMHKEATKIMRDYCSKNPKIYKKIIKEAMSGRIKFGEGSKASADFVLGAEVDGSVVHYNSVDDDSFVSKITSQTKPLVKFKSDSYKLKGEHTGKYVYRSVFGLMTTLKEARELEYRRDIMNESINEGVLASIWNKIKNAVQGVIDFITEGLKSMMDFFGISADLEFDNSVNFMV